MPFLQDFIGTIAGVRNREREQDELRRQEEKQELWRVLGLMPPEIIETVLPQVLGEEKAAPFQKSMADWRAKQKQTEQENLKGSLWEMANQGRAEQIAHTKGFKEQSPDFMKAIMPLAFQKQREQKALFDDRLKPPAPRPPKPIDPYDQRQRIIGEVADYFEGDTRFARDLYNENPDASSTELIRIGKYQENFENAQRLHIRFNGDINAIERHIRGDSDFEDIMFIVKQIAGQKAVPEPEVYGPPEETAGQLLKRAFFDPVANVFDSYFNQPEKKKKQSFGRYGSGTWQQ